MRQCLLDHLMSIVEYLISYSRIPMTGVYHNKVTSSAARHEIFLCPMSQKSEVTI